MAVKWDELTGPEIAELSKITDVAILPFGSLEMHGPHLPTSTDALVAQAISVRAAEMEPAIVLPVLRYTPAWSMKCYPGTISMPSNLMTRIFDAICSEAARNGFKKVIIFSGHGGCAVTSQLMEEWLEKKSTEQVDYYVYCVFIGDAIGEENARQFDGHGGAVETSWAMAAAAELVHIERVEEVGPILSPEMPGVNKPDYWNTVVPLGYKSDPRKADAQKGKEMLETAAKFLADVIKKVRRT